MYIELSNSTEHALRKKAIMSQVQWMASQRSVTTCSSLMLYCWLRWLFASQYISPDTTRAAICSTNFTSSYVVTANVGARTKENQFDPTVLTVFLQLTFVHDLRQKQIRYRGNMHEEFLLHNKICHIYLTDIFNLENYYYPIYYIINLSTYIK